MVPGVPGKVELLVRVGLLVSRSLECLFLTTQGKLGLGVFLRLHSLWSGNTRDDLPNLESETGLLELGLLDHGACGAGNSQFATESTDLRAQSKGSTTESHQEYIGLPLLFCVVVVVVVAVVVALCGCSSVVVAVVVG